MNLGKKISVPRDVMMEELNLNTNRGSIMFQERQRRVERFTLENSVLFVRHPVLRHTISGRKILTEIKCKHFI
uniref:Uncharacterized protein n=1 Tax=Sinocyclocheilus rhinocerous TaxID=307959 RepID=A0A673GEB1_9TELE